jgi:hypothetical protein
VRGTRAARRPTQDATPLGLVEQHAPQTTARLVIPRDLLDEDQQPGARTGLVDNVEVEELREFVLDPSTARDARDRVWRWLVERCRSERGDWYLVALYLAMPLLRDTAWSMAPVPPASRYQVAEAHSSLIVETLAAVHRVSLDRPSIAARLVGQAAYHARGRRRGAPPATADIPTDLVDVAHQDGQVAAYPPASDSPDLALDRLVDQHQQAPAGQRFTRDDAELIARTYFETAPNGGIRTLVEVAAELGITESAARARRDRAITRLARLLDATDRHGRPLTAADALTPSRAAVRRRP